MYEYWPSRSLSGRDGVGRDARPSSARAIAEMTLSAAPANVTSATALNCAHRTSYLKRYPDALPTPAGTTSIVARRRASRIAYEPRRH